MAETQKRAKTAGNIRLATTRTTMLAGVTAVTAIGRSIDVKSYIYGSLLDNFERTQGYGQYFGLVAVDRDTFVRTPKPSASTSRVSFARLETDRR